MKDRDTRIIKKVADKYLKFKGVKFGSLKGIREGFREIEEVIINFIKTRKREYHFLSNIYAGILKNERDEYYLYYRCPYRKRMIIRRKLDNINIYTKYHRMYEEEIC
jgi:hypothetical protein